MICLLLITIFIIGCNKDIEDKIVDSNTKFSEQDAKSLASNSECAEQGTLSDSGMYNSNSKTWWFDIEQLPEKAKEGCNPACVVWEETKQVEINWRCTGLKIPDEQNTVDIVTDFETCISAGNPAMESYPRQCRHDGKTYTEQIEPSDLAARSVASYIAELDDFSEENGRDITIKNSEELDCDGCYEFEAEYNLDSDVEGAFDIVRINITTDGYEVTEIEKARITILMCIDRCGDGKCAEIVCMGTGCPCSESANSCPEDCS